MFDSYILPARFKVPKFGKCLDAKKNTLSFGSYLLTQRLLEYYFKPRVSEEFVFSPLGLYRVTSCPRSPATH